jgi:hypothetical protein
MTKDRLILGTILYLLLTSCSTNSGDDKLTGHWHHVSTSGHYQTLDIHDSLTITDKYNLIGGEYLEYPRIDKQGRQILPSNFYELSTNFNLTCDTLVIIDSTKNYKYVKSDLNDCLISDRYYDTFISVSPKLVESAEKFEISYKQFYSADLFIGKPKTDSDFGDSLARAFPDSIFIQARDVIINLTDIQQLSKSLTYMWDDSKKQYNLNLHADEKVSDEFLKKVELMTPDTFAIHRIVRLKTDIGLLKIR